jgi:putative ABC transport system permease protein
LAGNVEDPGARPLQPSKGMTWSDLARDLRHALRLLARHPGFTAVAVLTFAVGIGINTAVFSVFSGILLRPLPYPDADRITLIWLDNRREGIREDIGSYPNFRDWRAESTSYEHMAGFTSTAFTLSGPDEPERLEGAYVSAAFFDVMGIRPALGRTFTEANETVGEDRVAVLSHGLWQRRFGGGPDVLGRTIALGGDAYEIIGVMPPALAFPADAELWVPLAPDDSLREARTAFWLPVIGRLKPGITPALAQTEMTAIAGRIEQEYEQMRGFGANVVPLHRQLVGDIEWSLIVLLGAVGFVLLIACANLGNLLLGRTAARRRELAIRSALGAQRWRIVRQIVTETLVLATAGGLVGLLLAFWVTEFFIALGGDTIPRPEAIRIDARVLAFTLALTFVSAILAGLVPALHASRGATADALKEGGRDGSASASRRTRDGLVVAEVALAFVLLAGAGLLVQTLWSLHGFDRGYRTDGVVSMTLSVSETVAPTGEDLRGFHTRLLERVRSLPGVEEAALASGILQPLVARSGIFSIEGKPLPPPEARVEYPFEYVTPGFFELLDVRPAAGRTFTDQDHADAPRAVVINETLARVGWPGQDPIGRRMRSGDESSEAPWMTVVGVIPDIRRADVTRPVRPELYLSASQVTPRTLRLLVRTAGEPVAVVPSVRAAVRELNPQVPLFQVETLSSALSRTMAPERFRAVLLAGFAAIALLLAAIGIYGVTSHAVGQRTQEIGVRMALGAGAGDVIGLVLGQHLRPALIGTGLGVAGALVLGRYLQSLVFGVAVSDWLTFTLMGCVLLAVAVAAAAIPALRATRVDPLRALRAQ